MPTLNEIEARAKRYAEAREVLAVIVGELHASIEKLKRSSMSDIKRAVARVAEQHDKLKEMIGEAPTLFAKPRTLTLHGIRCGYAKGKGGITYDDADAVVAAIQKHLPEQEEALIRWTGKPLKEALNQLDVSDLKRIGCRVVGTGDQIVIKPVDSEVDKLLDALIKDAVATEEDA